MKLAEKFKLEEKKRFKRWIIYFLALAIVILVIFWLILNNNIEQVRDESSVYISNTALQTAGRIDDVLDNTQQSVATFAQLYSDTMNSSEPDLKVTDDIADKFMCDFVECIDSSGHCMTADVDVSDREYYQKGIAGETGVDVIYNSRLSNSTLIVFYAPLVYEDQTVGVLLAGYWEDHMGEILAENYFGERAVSYLCERDGTVIACSSEEDEAANVLDFFTDELVSGTERETFLDALDNGTSCTFSVNGENGETVACLTQLDGTDWCIVQIYPSSATANRVTEINRFAIFTFFLLILVFAAYLLILTLIERRRRSYLKRGKDEAESVVDGVNRLFARFVIVDLKDDSYVYLKDYSNSPSSLERQGSYHEFVDYFSGRIIETAGDIRMQDALKPDFIYSQLDKNTPILRYNFCLRRDTGIHWENAAFVCLSRDASGIPVSILLAVQDITELHQREEKKNQALRDALSAAETANHAKDDFLSRMSHDMRTPMNAILGMAEIADVHVADRERVRDCLGKIQASGQHLLTMINAMLDLSKIENGRIQLNEQVFDVRQSAWHVVDYLRAQIEKKHLQVLYTGDRVSHLNVSGDGHLVQRILTNILENAVEYTPEGGTISLSMSEEISISDTSCYTFVCEDTGIGMSEELLAKVFEPFVSGEDSRLQQGQGIGLGLTIAKQFVRLMGGDITAESTPGKGSRFTVKIPLKFVQEKTAIMDTESAQQSASDLLSAQEITFEGCRVLLAEDNVMNAEITVELLRMLKVETDVAANGLAAVNRLLETETCPYDLILMDIQMPEMNGYEAAKCIRRAGREDLKEVPIIALSANAYRDDIDRSLASGMNAHLAKPVSCKALTELLKKWVRVASHH